MGIQKPPISKKSISELLKDHSMMEKAKLELDRRLKLEREMKEHNRLTEEKKNEIKRMMFPTSSLSGTPGSGGTPGSFGTMGPSDYPGGKYDPYTMSPTGEPLPYTSQGHKPEMWGMGLHSTSGLPKNDKPKVEQQHVVPSIGKKHHIEVQDMSHKIAPRRKSIIESIFGFVKTKTSGPK